MAGTRNSIIRYYQTLNRITNFKTIGTPVRGFYQNVRNGNSFALINNELRVPVFKYFSNKPIKSSFLANFMVVGFWRYRSSMVGGQNPYTSDNAFNTTLIEGFNYDIILQNQKRTHSVWLRTWFTV